MSEDEWLFPEMGELVVATVERVEPYGAYASLDEYSNLEGLLHISEISSRWVKNIRDHVRERQKTVLKVLRVDPHKKHIDLSLRRVNDRERREKLLEWKHERRGRVLLAMAAQQMNVTPEMAYEEIGILLEDYFGSLYAGFASMALQGKKAVAKKKISSEWADVLSEIAQSKLKIPLMKVNGVLDLTCVKPNGVNILKQAFTKAKKIRKPTTSNIRFYVIGAPKYRVEVTAQTYKDAERLLTKAVDTILDTVKTNGGVGEFSRSSSRR
jgi:translation initiation factor 2 subunit 1